LKSTPSRENFVGGLDMPIIQINLWVCEVCGEIYTTVSYTGPCMDPVVDYPTKEEWGYVGEGEDEKLACPNCLQASLNKTIILME